jgi:superfamily II DNA or RNA helicase
MVNGEIPAERTGDLTAYFLGRLGALSLRWPQQHNPALRSAQIGALLGLASHLSTSGEPGQAVLPTGVGKTAVICGLPFLVPSTRVLVVVPTRLLRDQLASEFAELATLQRLEIVSGEWARPRVTRVEHRLGTIADWETLRNFDVVVGTPGVLSANDETIVAPPQDLFDLLIFDEAHHLPATTWTGILQQHPAARAALLTATPFRRDRKQLPGRLAYHYSLRQAIADEVYSPVSFIPVVAQEPDFDREIARVAIARQATPLHVDEGSLLLVRTDRIRHARELVTLYHELGAQLGLITGEHSARHVRGVVQQLRAGSLNGVVSVGALVEGFDLPALKIAAYHRPHRSLPPTLQFVGRIARVTGGLAPAELVAVVGQIASETAELYREDVAWRDLLPQLSDTAVEEERAARDYDLSLVTSPERDLEELSPSALRPQRMVQAFRVPGLELQLNAPIARLSRAPIIFHAVDETGTLLASITARRVHPEWITSDVLDSFEHELYLAVHDARREMLFIAAPSDAAAREVRDAVGAPDAPLVSPQLINRWLWRQDLVAYSSVGMRSARAPGARQASYRMLAGSAVEGALLPSESRGYAVGHLIGRRRQGTQQVGVGVSIRRSKIWETTIADSLLAFRDWCTSLADALGTEGPAELTVPRLQLSLPGPLEQFPDLPLAVVLEHTLLQGDTSVFFPGRGAVDIMLFETPVERVDDGRLLVSWAFDSDVLVNVALHPDGTTTVAEGNDPVVRYQGSQVPLTELLSEYPPYVYYGDGSSTHGGTLLVPPAQLPLLPAELYRVGDFAEVDIHAESNPPGRGHRLNVQAWTLEWLPTNVNPEVTIVDDAAYEIADIVAIESAAAGNRVHLVHCKYSSEDAPGRRLADIYEVLGQAVRSARWTDSRSCWAELARRIRERPATRVMGADRTDVAARLDAWSANPPGLELHIWVIQPGLSQTTMTGWTEGQTLILAALEWCVTQGAVLHIVGSA